MAITIDSENLIELYQSIPGLKIIDSRFAEDHVQGYIENSLNLPLAKTNCASLDGLAGNKDQALVFYCNGNTADASIAAIQIASACGYGRLFWLRGGFVEWQDKDYPYMIE
jgi:rhodanese-related sulfurtransferase